MAEQDSIGRQMHTCSKAGQNRRWRSRQTEQETVTPKTSASKHTPSPPRPHTNTLSHQPPATSTNTQANRQTNKHAGTQPHTQTHPHTGTQSHTQTDPHTRTHAHNHTHTQAEKVTHSKGEGGARWYRSRGRGEGELRRHKGGHAKGRAGQEP